MLDEQRRGMTILIPHISFEIHKLLKNGVRVLDNLQDHSNGLKINIYSYQLPSFLKSARDISTRIISTPCVRRAPFMNARSLSDDGSRREFNHLYFRRFKRFLLHGMDFLSYHRMNVRQNKHHRLVCDILSANLIILFQREYRVCRFPEVPCDF